MAYNVWRTIRGDQRTETTISAASGGAASVPAE
jgi:hypothetical protein